MPKNMKVLVDAHIHEGQPYTRGQVIPAVDDWTAGYMAENGIAEETADGERIVIATETPKKKG